MDPAPSTLAPGGGTPYPLRPEPAVSWSAIFAGAVVALALAVVLTGLAAGFGLKLSLLSLSSRGSLTAFTPALGAWAIVVQVLSGGLGGYLAGRLRPKWTLHGDETHFRDTAHGLITWALSTVAGVVLVATVLAPYAQGLSDAATATAALAGVDPVLQAQRDANVAAQASFFMGMGLLLSAFVACVAAALGGLRSEEMHARL